MERFLPESKKPGRRAGRGRLIGSRARHSAPRTLPAPLRHPRRRRAAARGASPEALLEAFLAAGVPALRCAPRRCRSRPMLDAGRAVVAARARRRRVGHRQRSRRHRAWLRRARPASTSVRTTCRPRTCGADRRPGSNSSASRPTPSATGRRGLAQPVDYVAVGPVFETCDQGHRLRRGRPRRRSRRCRAARARPRHRRSSPLAASRSTGRPTVIGAGADVGGGDCRPARAGDEAAASGPQAWLARLAQVAPPA